MQRDTIVLPANAENISRAAKVIRDGGLVAFPTETVYGLGANALDLLAVASIFEAKQRPSFDPLIIHISEFSMLDQLAESNDIAKILADAFWPGPLTLVLKKKEIVPDLVSSGLDTVGLRIPNNKIALRLLQEAGVPIAAPSANPFGYLSPTNAQHVYEQLNGRVDIILDGGDCKVGVESTIVSLSGAVPVLLRPGGLSLEDLKTILPQIEHYKKTDATMVEAPGLLPWHYSPITPLRFFEENEEIQDVEDLAYLFFKTPGVKPRHSNFEVLSDTGDLAEAATNLFTALHKLDSINTRIIIAEKLPETGLGLAIMDRLIKASKRPQNI